MDVLETEKAQSGIKRPWEDGTALQESGNAWHSMLLPPIDAAPFCRASVQREGGRSESAKNGPDPKESAMKKAKFGGHDYNTFPRQNIGSNGKIPPTQSASPMYTQAQTRVSIESPAFPPKSRATPNGSLHNSPLTRDVSAESQGLSQLCRRCKRLAVQSQDSTIIGRPDSCDDCRRDPELAWVTQKSAQMLTHLAETLRSGISSKQHGTIPGSDQYPRSTSCPPIAEFGLKQTLGWLLSRIYDVNNLADQLVSQVRSGSLQNLDKGILRNGTKTKDSPAGIMQHYLDVESDDPFNPRDDIESNSKPNTRRTSLTTSMLVHDELPPLSSKSDYHPSRSASDGPIQRASGMNPPPVHSRQLPSPPGRPFPSPTSLSFPSPSTPSYGINTQSINLPPPLSLHQQSNSSYLPSISVSHSSDTALRDHTATLQHEVSVQKIALSSLQGEHDKLLAAFSRSQTRASALEKKHAVSDTEIITLTEEKLKLQAQVTELEREAEELSQSRSESRQAAVQEGSQYIEIVKKASRLEEMAGEERKNWNKLKEEMERKIEALSAGSSKQREATNIGEDSRLRDGMEINTPTLSQDVAREPEMEPTDEPHRTAPTSNPSGPKAPRESVEHLKAEILRLQGRCAEVENALRAMRDDSHLMENVVKTLLGRADLMLGS